MVTVACPIPLYPWGVCCWDRLNMQLNLNFMRAIFCFSINEDNVDKTWLDSVACLTCTLVWKFFILFMDAKIIGSG